MKREKPIAAILAIALMVWVAMAYEPSQTQTQMLADYNAYRTQKDLPTVTASNILMKTAQDYACKMSVTNYFNHYEKDWTGPTTRAKRNWYPAWCVWENIALTRNHPYTTQQVLTLWKKSPGHNANMVNKKWTEAGFWSCSWYWVQMFGKPASLPVIQTGIGTTYNTTTTYHVTTGITVYDRRWAITQTAYGESILSMTTQEFLQFINQAFSPYLNWRKLYIGN